MIVYLQYQISKYIAYLLGFSIHKEDVFLKKETVVTGKDLTGLDGFKVIK